MAALICGSLAYDSIMVFDGRFREHILPDKIHMLSVSFLVPRMRREFGGCAGNIAYNLRLMGETGHAMGAVGHDFGPYREWMDSHGVSREFVTELDEEFTAQAYIMTDLEDNQITAFHPGAMNHSHRASVPADAGIKVGIVAPDGREGMMQHAREFSEAGIPFIFDPGQGLPMFNGDELKCFIEQATYVAVNDYESGMLSERTGWSLEEIAGRVEALIVTRGGKGSHVYVEGDVLDIPAVKPSAVVDPTGCGDAYRGGLLFGLQRGLDWKTTARIAALCGSIKIEQAGTQNHRFTPEEFAARFEQVFSYAY